jgi:hypothetical protein
VTATRETMGVSLALIGERHSVGNSPEPAGAGERFASHEQRTRGGGPDRKKAACGPVVWARPDEQ